ncbi:serine protease [Saccharobesus litoralis]|uniref:Serine protease n=1 Tax=Saccharobesus litoralis TaxID=2172099 RepID=A0A2S0VSN7_9ALTE|nr:serine protease [Saccharobesus litoralis]AWB67192.1 serine protease [Saccharobesus litoralis]
MLRHPLSFNLSKLINLIVLSWCSFNLCSQTIASDNSDKVALPQSSQSAHLLFQQFEEQVFQIQLIENSSNKKSSIGSGFAIGAEQIVTNYHVVSSFIHHPELYRIQLLDSQQRLIAATLYDFDVVNDLAVLTIKDNLALTGLALAKNAPQQGDAIYSIGNPHDYGMIVVPGTYNGITANSFYQRIHFTGSINPGMSGGPVLNEAGEVIGVNVATAGNQLGFLVPLMRLNSLLSKPQPAALANAEQYQKYIELQLVANQQKLVDALIEHQWPKANLGAAYVFSEVAPFVPCWGGSNADKEKDMYRYSDINCRNKEQIYVSRELRTGAVEVQFSWIERHKLDSWQFSTLLSKSFDMAGPGNRAGEKDVTNYSCSQDFVNLPMQKTPAQTALCVRNYKKYPSLFDVLYMAVSSQNDQHALLSHFTLSGVNKDNANRFTRKFMELIEWQ